MADPFATGLGTLFAGPRAVAAVYDDGSSARPIRVIHERPDQETSFRDSVVVQATNLFRIQATDVAEPQMGDLVIVEAGTFRISEEPQRDTQALRWICSAEPV